MGFYINPADGSSKEEFLAFRCDKRLPEAPKNFDFSGDELPVCWMNNGAFTALGVAYSERELQAFNNPTDTRYKVWFLVKKIHLEEEAGLPKGWIENAQKEEHNG